MADSGTSSLNLALRVTADMKSAVDGMNEVTQSIRAAGKAASSTGQQMADDLQSSEDIVAAQMAQMARGHADLNRQQQASREAAAAAMEAQRKETEKLRKGLDGLLGSIDPASKALGKLDMQEERLRKSFKAGLIDESTYRDFLSKIDSQRRAVDGLSRSTRRLSLNSRTAARELRVTMHELMTGRYANAGNNILALGNQFGLLPPIFSTATLAAGGLAVAIGGIGYAAYTAMRDESAFNHAILQTGNYAGVTAGQLEEMTQRAGSAGGRFSEVRQVLTSLVSSGRFTGKTLADVSEAAVSMMNLTGKSADETLSLFSRMSENTTAWALETNRQYHWLDMATYQRIAALESQGNKEEAMSVAAAKFSSEAKQRLSELETQLNWLERAWKGVSDGVATFGEALRRELKVSLGLANLGEQIAHLEKSKRDGMTLVMGAPPVPWSDADEAYLQKLYRQRDAINQQNQAKSQQADIDEKAIAAQDALNKRWQQNRSDIEKEADAVEAVRQQYAAMWKTAQGRETLRERGVASADGEHFSGGQWDVDTRNLNPDAQKAEQYNKQLKQRLNHTQHLTELERVEADIRSGNLQNATRAEQEEARAIARKIDAQNAANKAAREQATISKRTFEENERFVKSLEALAAKRTESATVIRNQEIATRNLTDAQRAQAEAANAAITAQEFHQQNFKLWIEYLQLSGQKEQASLEMVREKYGQLRDEFTASGNTEGLSLVDKLLPAEEARIRADEIRRQFDELERYRSRQESYIQTQVQTGLISEIEGRRQLVDLHQQVADKISETLPLLREMAALPGAAGKDISDLLDRLDEELLKLKKEGQTLTSTFREGVSKGIESSLKGLATGTMTLSDAIRNLAKSIVDAMAQFAAQQLTQMAMGGLMGMFGGGASVGAAGVAALAAADGGYIRGPGTTTSDSIPARLSDGEYVVRAAAVSHYGVDFLHMLNATRLRRFATGGLASVSGVTAPVIPTPLNVPSPQAPAQPVVSPVIQQTLVLDAGEVAEAGLNSVRGERAFMTKIRANRQTIKQELG